MPQSKLEALLESRDKAQGEYRALLDSHFEALNTRALTDEEVTAEASAEQRVAQFETAIDREKADEERAAKDAEERARRAPAPVITVGAEPMTYGPGNPQNSYFRDRYILAGPRSPRSDAAYDRLMRHQGEVDALAKINSGAATVDERTAKRADTARNLLQEARRFHEDIEHRDVSTSTGSMGDFAPPIYDLDSYAPWRTFGRAFINQLRSAPLPETGMTVYVPRISTPTVAVNQTAGNGENGSITSQDLVATDQSAGVQTIMSNTQVSQQMIDRIGPAGYTFDTLAFADQGAQTNRQLDAFGASVTLANIVSTGSSVAYTDTAFNAYKFSQTLYQAKSKLATTDGIVTYPTHIFSSPDLLNSIFGSYDSSDRPFVVPTTVAFNPLAVGDFANVPEGATGFVLAGVQAYQDQNIWLDWTYGAGGGSVAPFTAAASASYPTIVGDFNIGALWMEGAPVMRVLPEPGAATLTVLVQSYTYAACIIRYPGAFVGIWGTGTSTGNTGIL